MFYEDNEPGEVGFSFADLEKREAAKLCHSLGQLDDRIYTEVGTVFPVTQGDNDDDLQRNYYSEGYDANYEGVDDKELMQWQHAFSYIRVCGTATGVDNQTKDDAGDDNAHMGGVDPRDQHIVERVDEVCGLPDFNGLMIRGQRLISIHTAHSGAQLAVEEDEEIIMSHGVLEEPLVVDATPDSLPLEGTTEDMVSAEASLRDQVVAEMVDAIWPDLVNAYKPLIRNVLIAAKEQGLPYRLDQSAPVEKAEDEFGGFGFASDEEGDGMDQW